MTGFSGTYEKDDVEFLLNVGDIPEISIFEKEKLLSKGHHYGNTLTQEMHFDDWYIGHFKSQSVSSAPALFNWLLNLVNYLRAQNAKVIVSLARAGTPYGVIIKRLLNQIFLYDITHFSISIIKGHGIDCVAMKHIQQRFYGQKIFFLDGWTGAGSIGKELKISLKSNFPTLKWSFITVSDIAGVADVSASNEDIFLPSCMLNSSVSGMVSRTLLPQKANEFHRVKFFSKSSEPDYSKWYVECVLSQLKKKYDLSEKDFDFKKMTIQNHFRKFLKNLLLTENNLIPKPGIGETTRCLIRRKPLKILIRDEFDFRVGHIMYLSKKKNVSVELIQSMPFNAIGLI